jgi:hypothetical protein
MTALTVGLLSGDDQDETDPPTIYSNPYSTAV